MTPEIRCLTTLTVNNVELQLFDINNSEIGIYTFTNHAILPDHKHDWIHTITILHGEFDYYVEGQPLSILKKGDASIYTPVGLMHGLKCRSGAGVTMHVRVKDVPLAV